MLYDSHAHLNNEDFSPEERAEFIERIERAVESGLLSYVNDIGFDMPSSRMALEHALRYPWCYAAIGVHPHDADKLDEDDLLELARMAVEHPDRVKAIGEIGLDYHYEDGTDPDIQRFWFRKQIRLARALDLPIAVHSRDADGDTFEILKQEYIYEPQDCDVEGVSELVTTMRVGLIGTSEGIEAPSGHALARMRDAAVLNSPFADGSGSLRTGCAYGPEGLCPPDAPTDGQLYSAKLPLKHVLLHCYSGSAELAKEYVKLGAMLSIAGPVTYKNNKKTVRVVEEIPLEHLLIETDSPYLTPVPHRGERNHPVNVRYTAEKIAEIKGISYEEVARVTRENALRFFRI